MKPLNALPSQGMTATEAVTQVPAVAKWLLCIQIQALGKDCPQSFSMYPRPPV